MCSQVKRALLGAVKPTSGYLLEKARDLSSQYKDSLSVVKAWRIGDISPSINIVNSSGVLGKPKTSKRVLSDEDMAKYKVVT